MMASVVKKCSAIRINNVISKLAFVGVARSRKFYGTSPNYCKLLSSVPPSIYNMHKASSFSHGNIHKNIMSPTSYYTHQHYLSSIPSFIIPRTSLITMKMSTSTTNSISHLIESSSLTDEEKSVYHELKVLSAKIRKLDESYYGGITSGDDNDTTTNSNIEKEVSDDEYDALARREAEICTLYPKLLTLLEEESGLGPRATRFGGRVGQLYVEEDGSSTQSKKDEKKTKKKKPRKVTKKRIKRQHLQNAPMQSLDNAMNDVEAVAWLNRVRKLLISSYDNENENYDKSGNDRDNNNITKSFPIQVMSEPKIDGLSLSLRYQLRDPAANSSSDRYIYEFVWGATRGDGKQGEDVSEAVQSAWMKANDDVASNNFSIPKSITILNPNQSSESEPPAAIEVRGEVVLPQQAFDEFTTNVTTTAKFSNARNAASGILLRSKEPTSEEEIEQTRFLQSHLQFYAYDIVASDLSPTWLSALVGNNGGTMRDSLTKLGFHVPTPVLVESLDISLDKEWNETDIPKLLEYHRNLMAARDRSVASAKPFSNKTSDFPYQIDGVVYKLLSFNDRQICGSSSRTPRWAIAHKFPPQVAVTRLIDVEVQVGRTGALTPVAILEPVDLGGVMVSRASLHNFHFARSLLLPKNASTSGLDEEHKETQNQSNVGVKKGVSVLVSRAGDVIPQVKKRVFEDDSADELSFGMYSNEMISLEAPQKCPACGSPTSYEFVTLPKKEKVTRRKVEPSDEPDVDNDFDDDPDESGQVLRCSGPQLLCQPRAVNALSYAYSRAGLDVKGLSKAKLSHLMEEGIIRFPSDLFTTFGSEDSDEQLENKQLMLNNIADLPGWGEQSSQNVAESVRSVASEGVTLSRYIYSLGISTIGTHVSQLIASAYGNVKSFLKAMEESSLYDEDRDTPPFATLTGEDGSEKVKGIGPTAISALVSFSKEKVLMKAAKDLADVLTIHDDRSHNATSAESSTSTEGDGDQKPSLFEGMTVVFTGSIPGMSRTMAQNAVKELGAKATPNTVSKSTTLVVEGEKGGKKATQARELGVRVVDYTEFMKMISQ